MKSNLAMDISCILHTHCNLRCKFCFETKEKGIRENNNINIDYIRQLPDKIINKIKPIIKEKGIKHISVDIIGGELFSDDIPDSVFDEYKNFAYNIKSKLKLIIPEYRLSFFTNGIYRKYDRVLNLIKDTNSLLVMSYDPCDRFSNDKPKEIWYNTFKYFQSKNIEILLCSVLTKKNIYGYINGDDIFEKIGNKVPIIFLEYSARLDYKEYLPNDEDLWNFYKWCLDNEKFNIDIVNDLMLKNPTPTCNKGISYHFDENLPNGSINYCTESSAINKKEYFGEKIYNSINNDDYEKYKQPLGLQKRGCLMCEYCHRCPKMCWYQILFSKYEITECPIKRVYQYLEENPSILEKYNEWSVTYGQINECR